MSVISLTAIIKICSISYFCFKQEKLELMLLERIQGLIQSYAMSNLSLTTC